MKLNTKNIVLGLIASASIVSCNRYLDINDDPNNIPIEKASPNFIFAGTVSESYKIQARRLNLLTGLMMNSFAGNTYSYSTPFINEYSFNLTTGFYSDIWDDTYRNIANFQVIIDYNDPHGKYSQYKAMSKIMKAYYFQILVDFYNDLPYSEFGKRQQNLYPKYDKSEDIYKASIQDIDNAIALIDAQIANPSDHVVSPSGDDIVYQGNMENWKKFANTIKLRYLMRMSKVTGEMATFRDNELNKLSSASFITSDVQENPGYGNQRSDMQSPFAGYFTITIEGKRPSNYTLVVPSENMATALNGNVGNATPSSAGAPLPGEFYQKFNGIVDGRRGRIFTINRTTRNVEGVRQGQNSGQPGAESGRTNMVGRLGFGLSMGAQTPTTVAELVSYASSMPGTLMTYAEAKFLLAEAALVFPQYFSGGQAHFEEGIKSSFDRLGASGSAAYITSISNRAGLGWFGTNEQKLDAIMTQKWIALTGVNLEQSYFDYLKTGYPNVPTSTLTTKRRPYRLLYPTSEYSSNSNNVPNVSADQCFTKNVSTPFWNRN